MKIKENRILAGMTQKQLADALQVPQQTVSNWETVANPRAEMIPKIAAALNCTTDALFYGVHVTHVTVELADVMDIRKKAPLFCGEEVTDDDPKEVHQAVHGAWHEPEQGE